MSCVVTAKQFTFHKFVLVHQLKLGNEYFIYKYDINLSLDYRR